MKRESIRENVVQLVYQMDMNSDFDYENLSFVDAHENLLKEKQAVFTLKNISANIAAIDAIITRNIKNWNPERVAKTDMAIMRVATCEMMYDESIPNNVSINEAVELAKKYGDEKSYAFINSVLGKINKELLKDE